MESLRPLFHVPPAQLLSLVLSPRLVEASHPHTLFLYQPPPPPVPQASSPQSSLQPLSPATHPPQLPTLVQLLPSAPRVPSSVSLSVSSFRSVSSTYLRHLGMASWEVPELALLTGINFDHA